jgi:glutathione-regulated potassium-efflux system ancillary protein KefG
MKILILFAHPAYQRSRANRRLLEAVEGLDGIYVRDLYEMYPDFQIDVPFEKQLLQDHDLIVFQHPFYWYSCPALLKEWQDLVLEHGFAYGEEGSALHGKRMLTAITTSGGQDAYGPDGLNRFTIRELLRPFEQTAFLCGMDYLPPFVAHGIHAGDDSKHLDQYSEDYRSAIVGLRDGTIRPEDLAGIATLNDAIRPEPREGGTKGA